MGLLGKIKDLFADEDVYEEPIKKDVIKVEIAAPRIEPKEEITDSQALIKEEKPAPIFFNDKDFEDINALKEVVKPRSAYIKAKKEEEVKKIFKPTPIISPVYGVLDKNYRKDDITEKEKKEVVKEHKNLTIDEIRKKAFGTLEEDLENELFAQSEPVVEEELPISENDIFDDMEEEIVIPERRTRSEIYDDFREIETTNLNSFETDNEDSEDYFSENNEEYVEETYEEVTVKKVQINDGSNLEEDLQTIFDDSNEQIEEDLFNLIDSMYERGDE